MAKTLMSNMNAKYLKWLTKFVSLSHNDRIGDFETPATLHQNQILWLCPGPCKCSCRICSSWGEKLAISSTRTKNLTPTFDPSGLRLFGPFLTEPLPLMLTTLTTVCCWNLDKWLGYRPTAELSKLSDMHYNHVPTYCTCKLMYLFNDDICHYFAI